jgi:HSP90 family molecular chaperone
LGFVHAQENRPKLSKLLRFFSSKSEDAQTSLEAYQGRMKAGQKAIYYMAADSIDVAKSAPFVEKLIKKGYEVRCASCRAPQNFCMPPCGAPWMDELMDGWTDGERLSTYRHAGRTPIT